MPGPFAPRENRWLVVPLHHVFGSDELSVLAPGVAQLAPRPYLALSRQDAQRLQVNEGGQAEIVIGGETRRLPFDIPEAESELVAGYHSEYSSMKFAMFFLGEYLGSTLISAVMVTLFFGGWLGPWLPGPVWFGLKTLVFLLGFILARASLPRPRHDQLVAFGWKAMLPLALANLWVTGAVVLWSKT